MNHFPRLRESCYKADHVFLAGDVSAKAMNLLLRFIYTNKPTEHGRLPGWLMRQIPEGVEEMFDAADRFLVFSLKVASTLWYNSISCGLLKGAGVAKRRLCFAEKHSTFWTLIPVAEHF